MMKLKKEFKCFVPMEDDKGNSMVKMNMEKDSSGKVTAVFFEGVASNSKVDREGDRMTAGFLQKMGATAKGLTLFSEHKHDIDHALGHIVEAHATENEFRIKAKAESPETNPLVKSIVEKINSGIKIGFSVYGSILEANRVWDEQLQKEVTEISDGELEEVSITPWPAAYDCFAVAVSKSAKDKSSETPNFDFDKSLFHSSKVNASEPDLSTIDKASLPKNAFAMAKSDDKSDWFYPHHYIVAGKKNESGVYISGTMVLHRAGLNAAWDDAMSGKQVSPAVISHLKRHRTALGLQDAGKMLTSVSEKIDISNNELGFIEEELSKLLITYAEALQKSFEGGSYEEKLISAKEVTEKYAVEAAALIAKNN